MLASECLTLERLLLTSPSSTNGRWSDTSLLNLTDRSVKALVAEVLFPESRITQPTVASQQEYALPDMLAIYRVYVNGQLCVPTPGNVDTLEGAQIDYDDQSGTGSVSAGAAQGGTAEQPAWAVQTPVSYPYLNGWGSPAPQAQPWSSGQRPRYYRRGGLIGFVPAPLSSGATITVDCVRVPATITDGGQVIVLPENFMDALVQRVIYYANIADKDAAAQQMARAALADYKMEVRRLRSWKRQYSLDESQLFPQTYRGAYKIGGNRVGSL